MLHSQNFHLVSLLQARWFVVGSRFRWMFGETMMLNGPAKKLSLEQLEKNFADINPPLTPAQALEEGSRCLFCHDAPCIKACPTEINVPQFIRQILSGNM